MWAFILVAVVVAVGVFFYGSGEDLTTALLLQEEEAGAGDAAPVGVAGGEAEPSGIPGEGEQPGEATPDPMAEAIGRYRIAEGSVERALESMIERFRVGPGADAC